MWALSSRFEDETGMACENAQQAVDRYFTELLRDPTLLSIEVHLRLAHEAQKRVKANGPEPEFMIRLPDGKELPLRGIDIRHARRPKSPVIYLCTEAHPWDKQFEHQLGYEKAKYRKRQEQAEGQSRQKSFEDVNLELL